MAIRASVAGTRWRPTSGTDMLRSTRPSVIMDSILAPSKQQALGHSSKPAPSRQSGSEIIERLNAPREEADECFSCTTCHWMSLPRLGADHPGSSFDGWLAMWGVGV